MKTILNYWAWSLCALLMVGDAYGQAGSLDVSFNSTDIGFGYGDAINGGGVTCMLEQPDGKILLGGDFFTKYSNLSRNRVVRLQSNGSVDLSFDPGTGANDAIYSMVLLSDGKILIAGNFTSYNGVSRNRIARINSDGSLDTGFNPGSGFNGAVRTIALLSDGRILAGGFFSSYNGSNWNNVLILNANGTVDSNFNIGTGSNGEVSCIAVQADGMILLGGNFTQFNGTPRNYILRLNASGVVDPLFNPGGGANNRISRLVVQNDNKILVAGDFTQFNSISKSRITRLNADGTIDVTFDIGSGFNAEVKDLKIQSDGKICVTGQFYTYNGSSVFGICRILSSGILDNTFASGTGLWGGTGYSLAFRSDGRLLLGGVFSSFNKVYRKNIICLNTDGQIDLEFNKIGTGINGEVIYTTIQPDGKILVSGYFSLFNGTTRNCIVRLNSDGTLDGSFDPGIGPDGVVYSMVVQPDGKIIVVGLFNNYANVSRNNICRIHSDGTLDASFNVGYGTNMAVTSVALQTDGKVVIGGQFGWYDGQECNVIARLHTNGTLDNSFVAGTGFNAMVQQLVIQPDNKIIVSGQFTEYDGVTANQIARLNANGSLDSGFNSGTGVGFWEIKSILLLNDGRILIGGSFQEYNGVSKSYLAMLSSNGSLDNTFNSGGSGPGSVVFSLSKESNGKILIAGMFNTYNGNYNPGLLRVLPNGTIDWSYNVGSGVSGIITAIAIQADDNLVIGGSFLSFNGVGRNRVARVNFSSCVAEVCNGVDDDCDGQMDEGFNVVSYYQDLDADGYGYGLANNTCSQPTGYVMNNSDCMDGNASVFPGAQEICNSMDDDCDGQQDDGLVMSAYYLDQDGDDFGAGTEVLLCMAAPNYVLLGADCDDGNYNISPVQSENCYSAEDDNCDGQINENCVSSGIIGDDYNYPIVIGNINNYGVGSQTNYSFNLSTMWPSALTGGYGKDIWYRFTAQHNALRVKLKGDVVVNDDNMLILYAYDATTSSMIPMVFEDDVYLDELGLALDGGDEILYSDQLIIGQEYFICVNNTNNVAGNGVISLSYLRGSQADIGPFTNYTGVYNSTCSNFKATYRFGAYQYTIQRLSENDPLGNIEYSYTIPNTGGAVASTICQLGKILSANLSGIPQTFYVRVDVQYWMPDAYGNFEMLVAPGLNASTIGLNSESDLYVRTTDQCPVYKRVSSSIATNRSICGTSEYNWQFTMVYPQVGLPMEWTGGYGGSRMFPLSMLEGIANGQRYDVRIQSSHIDGASISDFGSVKCVRTLGAAGMLMDDAARFSATEVEGVQLYPNPNNGEAITLNITGMDGNIMISIWDATGRLLQSTTGYSEGNLIKELEFAQTLSSGLYEVRVSNGRDQKVVRMMVGR